MHNKLIIIAQVKGKCRKIFLLISFPFVLNIRLSSIRNFRTFWKVNCDDWSPTDVNDNSKQIKN
jgi:hypothetical protein